MARVIKEIPRVEKQVLCNSCGSTIAYVKNDVITNRAEDFVTDPNFIVSSWIKCPECEKTIFLES